MNGRATQLGRGGLTPGVKILLIANGVAYLLSLLVIHWIAGDERQGMLWIYELMLTPGEFWHGKVWQLVTYMFLHDPFSPMHILFNMLILWMFGTLFEPTWGTRRFIFFYMMCGIGGGLAVALTGLVFQSVMFFQVPVLGASAAVLGFVIAFGVTFPNQYVYFFFLVPVQGRYVAVATVALDILWNFFGGRIASHAHIGGMLTAYLLLTGYWRPSRLKRLKGRLDQKRRHKQMRKNFRDNMRQ